MPVSQEAEQQATEAAELVELLKPLFAGRAREVQMAALADMLAMWLAGHFAGDREANKALREELLAHHIELVRELIEPSEAQILEHVRRGSS